MEKLYDKPLEAAILGICLLEPAAYYKTASILSPNMFYTDDHQTTYLSLKELADSGIEIDLLTVNDHMERTKKLKSVDPHQTGYFLCRLTNYVTSSAHLTRWCTMVKCMWQDRQLKALRPESVADLQKAVKDITAGPAKNPKTKQYRFLLNLVEKGLLKPSINKLGANLIRGQSKYTYKVSSPLLVYLMSVCEPNYTWTCGKIFNEELTNDQCKARLEKDAILTSAGWMDKTHKYPVSWR